jgi:mannose-6-phosphate isomerase-like protein (cupin superfamily)
MDEGLEQIGERLKGLREVLNISVEEIAETCGIPVDRYIKTESGNEMKASDLYKISKKYGIAMDVLMFGEEPRMNSYFVTRNGKGLSVERRKAYKYQSLAAGYKEHKMDPYVVTVEPKPDDVVVEKNSHAGEEFNFVLEGRMELTINDKVLVLNEGDSIYFNSSLPHCMRALDHQQLKFIAIAL